MVKYSPYPDLLIPERPVHEFVIDRMRDYGEDVAMIDIARGTTIRFSEMREQIAKLSSVLQKRGLGKGDVVAISASSRIEYPVIMLAVASCGAISTTCNPLYTEGELLHQFRLSRPMMAFCELEVLPKIKRHKDGTPYFREVFTFGEVPGMISYESLVNSVDACAFTSVPIESKEDLFILPFSSGTTGLAKGVMLTHYNFIARVLLFGLTYYMSRCSCFYMSSPMFHASGYSFMLHCLAYGVKNVFDCRPQPEKLLQAVERHKVTHCFAIPTTMLQLIHTDLSKKYDTSSLKRMMCGAAPTAPSLISAISERYNVVVTPCYGLTEALPVTLSDPIVKIVDSVGTIVPNTRIKVIHIETGVELGPGDDGEILIKGPQLMKGYLGIPSGNAGAFDADGWFYTGDYGHYDNDGMLYVVDRLKEMINCEGCEIAPAELEAILLKHPDISDVAVIGVPDPNAGELPKAFVVRKTPTLTAQTVQKIVEGTVIEGKYLRGGVQFIDAIPKSASGKILRRVLRELPTVQECQRK